MKWEPVIEIDNLFTDMQNSTMLLLTNTEDSLIIEDFTSIKENNTGARVEFTSGIREIITKEQIEIAKELSDKVTRVMKELEQECEGELVGLDFKIKSEDSLNRKFKNWEDYSSSGSLSSAALKRASENTHDVLRFTLLFDERRFVEKFFKTKDILKNRKMSFVKIKNTFGANGTYKGINTFVLAKDDKYNYVFELQFHTSDSFNAKEKAHVLYEIERDSSNTDKDRKKAKEDQVEIFNGVNPPDYYYLIEEVNYLNEIKVGAVNDV